MAIISKNPATEEIIKEFQELSDHEIMKKVGLAHQTFNQWKITKFSERAKLLVNLAGLLKKKSTEIGKVMTLEMGKPLASAVAEAEKCAWVCEYYAENGEKLLQQQNIQSEASDSYVRFDPLGVILAIMPWNFPFWQVLRFAAPTVMAGNTGLLKHASNVPQSSELIEQLFLEAGFPKGVFQNMLIGSSKVEQIIADDRIMAVTLTGSEYAGSKVAETAGKYLKKTVLELGGSDPFIVLKDADLDFTCSNAVTGRLQNNGQSCIAAKRFIVVESIYDEFLDKFKKAFEAVIVGDPMDVKTQVGPLVNQESLADISEQVKRSVKSGARLVTGGKRIGTEGYYYAPTILAEVTADMPAYKEEIFGPVASVLKATDADDAVRVANDSKYGLGASIWTKDTKEAEMLAARIESGCVFINGIVKSDPRLPFGGIKKSGYGRELSEFGIKEFTNIKTVWIK